MERKRKHRLVLRDEGAKHPFRLALPRAVLQVAKEQAIVDVREPGNSIWQNEFSLSGILIFIAFFSVFYLFIFWVQFRPIGHHKKDSGDAQATQRSGTSRQPSSASRRLEHPKHSIPMRPVHRAPCPELTTLLVATPTKQACNAWHGC